MRDFVMKAYVVITTNDVYIIRDEMRADNASMRLLVDDRTPANGYQIIVKKDAVFRIPTKYLKIKIITSTLIYRIM